MANDPDLNLTPGVYIYDWSREPHNHDKKEPEAKTLNIIGDIYCDVVAAGVPSLPAWGKDTAASSIRFMAGGSALNSVVHNANFIQWSGVDVVTQFFGAVGKDPQGKLCLDRLKDVSKYVVPRVEERIDQHTGSCVVVSNATSDRCFITDHNCANDNMSTYWFGEDVLMDCNHFHVST